MINALGYIFFLFLDKDESSRLFQRLPQYIVTASQRTLLHTEGASEVSDLLKIGYLGPIQEAVRKVTVQAYGHKEPPKIT